MTPDLVTFHFNKQNQSLTVLDQRQLPNHESWLTIADTASLKEAIRTLAIRGAPLLGYAGLVGVYFSLLETKGEERWHEQILSLRAVRPTAVNLSKEVDQAYSLLISIQGFSHRLEACLHLIEEYEHHSKQICEAIATYGCSLIHEGDGLLTHCNTGSLATIGLGTALGVIKKAFSLYPSLQIYHTETRPLWQGSRLTAYELMKCHIPATIVIDSAVSVLMAEGSISSVIVGADRIARNGDTANKIGTLALALSARYFKIPFYVAAPTSTFDTTIESGKDIPIELRNEEEILLCGEKKIAPLASKAWNPAFDITPKELISAFITEKGINP